MRPVPDVRIAFFHLHVFRERGEFVVSARKGANYGTGALIEQWRTREYDELPDVLLVASDAAEAGLQNEGKVPVQATPFPGFPPCAREGLPYSRQEQLLDELRQRIQPVLYSNLGENLDGAVGLLQDHERMLRDLAACCAEPKKTALVVAADFARLQAEVCQRIGGLAALVEDIREHRRMYGGARRAANPLPSARSVGQA